MTTYTITLPDSVVVTSRGIESQVDCAKFSDALVLKLALHGLDQKVSDAASGAAGLAVKDKFGDKAKPVDHKPFLQSTEGKNAVAVHTQALMDKAVAGLEAGEWSQRGTGAGAVSEETHVQRIVAKAALKGKLGGDSDAWKEFLASDKGEQSEKLDSIWAKNATALEPAFKHELEVRKAKRAAPKVDIEL